MLSKQAPLSVEMQQAVLADQAVVKDVENQEFNYTDNIQEAEFLAVVDETTFEQCNKALPTAKPPCKNFVIVGLMSLVKNRLKN